MDFENTFRMENDPSKVLKHLIKEIHNNYDTDGPIQIAFRGKVRYKKVDTDSICALTRAHIYLYRVEETEKSKSNKIKFHPGKQYAFISNITVRRLGFEKDHYIFIDSPDSSGHMFINSDDNEQLLKFTQLLYRNICLLRPFETIKPNFVSNLTKDKNKTHSVQVFSVIKTFNDFSIQIPSNNSNNNSNEPNETNGKQILEQLFPPLLLPYSDIQKIQYSYFASCSLAKVQYDHTIINYIYEFLTTNSKIFDLSQLPSYFFKSDYNIPFTVIMQSLSRLNCLNGFCSNVYRLNALSKVASIIASNSLINILIFISISIKLINIVLNTHSFK